MATPGGWLLLMELDGLNSNAVLRRYTWGLDLAGLNGGQSEPRPPGSGPLESAGSIGGLLSVQEASDPNAPYVFFYDGNGNVTQVAQDIRDPVLTVAAKLKARYEYDPYGNVVGPNPDGNDVIDPNEAGPYAAANTFRFSTKQWDDATGFGYWGMRYYMPRVGRWMSRDVVGELDGSNLLGFSHNSTLVNVDPLGLTILDPSTSKPSSQPSTQPDRCDPNTCKRWCDKYPNDIGLTICKDGARKYCVCTDNIKHADELKASDDAQGIVATCVVDHESVHATLTTPPCPPKGEGPPPDQPAGEDEECEARQKGFVCIRMNYARCKNNACLQALYDLLERSHCPAAGCPKGRGKDASKECENTRRSVQIEIWRRMHPDGG